VLAAFNRVKSLLDEQQPAGWARAFGNSAENEDLTEALKLVQAEIGLSRVRPSDQCDLLKAGRNGQPVAEENSRAAESSPERATVRLAIRDAVEKLDSLKPEEQLPPLTRQASLDLMSHFARNILDPKSNFLKNDFARNIECAEEVVKILQRLDLNHPTDERVMQLLLAITEAIAVRKTASLDGRPAEPSDRGNSMIEVARKIYQRIAATGSDRTVALTRLAIIAEAQRAEEGDEGKERFSSAEMFENLKRAWQRHEHDINGTRERGELILSFWAMVLMRYLEDMLLKDFSDIDAEEAAAPDIRNAIASKTEFERALRTLYPTARPAKLADLPHLEGIGPRIGCLCMLSYVTTKSELADFFIDTLDKWQKQNIDKRQKQNIDQLACRRDLIPETQTRVPIAVRRSARLAEQKFRTEEDALRKAEFKKEHEEAQKKLLDATETAKKYAKRYQEKTEAVNQAAKACYVDAPASPAPTVSSSSP